MGSNTTRNTYSGDLSHLRRSPFLSMLSQGSRPGLTSRRATPPQDAKTARPGGPGSGAEQWNFLSYQRLSAPSAAKTCFAWVPLVTTLGRKDEINSPHRYFVEIGSEK